MNFQSLHESMHSTVPYTVTRSNDHVFKAEADFDGKTIEYSATLEDEIEDVWEIAFKAKGASTNQKFALTNDGNALKVFSFVIAATQELIGFRAPHILMFTADKDNGSEKRIRVYEKLIGRLAGGYEVKKQNAPNAVRFLLRRK